MDLRISVDTVGGRRVLALDGAADMSAVPALHDAIARLLVGRSDGAVAVDLDGVTLLDDAAIGLLVGASARAASAGTDFVVVSSPGAVRHRLAATRVDEIVRVVDALPTMG